MSNTEKLTFPSLFSNSCHKWGDNDALAFVDEPKMTYNQMKKSIDALVALFEKLGVKPGDKIAILSANMPNWGVSYFAATFMGAIAVPMLPDFSGIEINNILNHSEAKIVVVSESIIGKLKEVSSPYLNFKLKIEDFSIIDGNEAALQFIPNAKPALEYRVEEDDLSTIIYTSGTTGNSKGVMLTHKNICFDAIGAGIVQPISPEDRFLSILPLSHAYENTLGFILPMMSGASVHYLRKPPTAPVLLPALKSIRPTIMLSVPLIIEKIYKNKIAPKFAASPVMRTLYKVPPVRKFFNKMAGKKLMETFGGEIKFFGIGGAKLDKTVEAFLIEAKFPYAIGYGLTETSPMIAGVNPKNTIHESTGPAMHGIELKINDPDPISGEGEVWARGPVVMQGYYKEPELTKAVITEDGWFKTGDLAVFDKKGNLFIKGRLKNMIVGASGENIYPEEIESVINNFRHVVESVVIQQKGKLVAMVHFNREEIEGKYKHLKEEVSSQVEQRIEELQKELHNYINSHVSKFSQIQKIMIHSTPFQKTATMKIKRFLYSESYLLANSKSL